MAAFFFTSYARLDNNRFSKLGEAVDELRERVRARLGANDPDEVGFFDVRDIKTGQEWVDRLGHAVSRCRVFVCFCSNTYFNREICGREFEVFRQRLQQDQPGARRVFPVIWDKCDFPQSIAQYNYTDANFPKEYAEDGLCSLRRLRREAEYETTIEALAGAIAQAAADPPMPDGPHPVDFDNCASAFDNPSPDAIQVGAFHDDGLLWAVEIGRTLRAVAEEAAAKERTGWRQLLVGDDAPQTIGELTPVVLIMPSIDDLDAIWQQRLRAVDDYLAAHPRATCAVLVPESPRAAPANQPAAAGDERALAQALPESSRQPHLHAVYERGSAASLLDGLRAATGRLRMAVVERGDVARVEAEGLEEAARNAGVPVDAQPMVSASGDRDDE